MPRKDSAAGLARFTVEIPVELKARLAEAAKREDRSSTAIVRRALEAYLAKSEVENG